MSCAALCCAVLCCAVLRCAVLRCAADAMVGLHSVPAPCMCRYRRNKVATVPRALVIPPSTLTPCLTRRAHLSFFCLCRFGKLTSCYKQTQAPVSCG